MWIKTAFDSLRNIERHTEIELFGDSSVKGGWVVQSSDSPNIFASGTKDEMLAILDRIARGIAAGIPLLDLGQSEEPPTAIADIMDRLNAQTLRVDRSDDGWEACLYVYGGDLICEVYGPTPDAAIANLKPTGK